MSTWMFQGTPKRYGIIEYLRAAVNKDNIIRWGINQKRAIPKISINDAVFIWKSQGKDDLVGIVAFSKIKCLPKKMKEDRPNLVIDLKDNGIGVY